MTGIPKNQKSRCTISDKNIQPESFKSKSFVWKYLQCGTFYKTKGF